MYDMGFQGELNWSRPMNWMWRTAKIQASGFWFLFFLYGPFSPAPLYSIIHGYSLYPMLHRLTLFSNITKISWLPLAKREVPLIMKLFFWCCDWIGKRWSDCGAFPMENCVIRKADQRNRGVFYRNIRMETCNLLLDQFFSKMNSWMNILSLNFQDSRKFSFFSTPYLTGVLVLNQVHPFSS